MGQEGDLKKDKLAYFSTLFLEPSAHFIFQDPTAEQRDAYSALSERVLGREDVLSSPDLDQFKRLLDVVVEYEAPSWTWIASKRNTPD